MMAYATVVYVGSERSMECMPSLSFDALEMAEVGKKGVSVDVLGG
jgi:hypothetical protein